MLGISNWLTPPPQTSTGPQRLAGVVAIIMGLGLCAFRCWITYFHLTCSNFVSLFICYVCFAFFIGFGRFLYPPDPAAGEAPWAAGTPIGPWPTHVTVFAVSRAKQKRCAESRHHPYSPLQRLGVSRISYTPSFYQYF